MNEQYRGFNLYGGCEPISETSHITPNRKTFFVYHRFGSKIVRPLESRLLAGRASAHSPCSDSRCFHFNLRVADCRCATFAASQNYSLLDCVRSFTVTASSCLRLNGAQEVKDRGTGSLSWWHGLRL